MNRSRIITPFGNPMQPTQIHIDIDADLITNKIACNCKNPLPPATLGVILLNVLGGIIGQLAQAESMIIGGNQNNQNNQNKEAGETNGSENNKDSYDGTDANTGSGTSE